MFKLRINTLQALVSKLSIIKALAKVSNRVSAKKIAVEMIFWFRTFQVMFALFYFQQIVVNLCMTIASDV
mgnify:CR=1 FL=1